MSAEKFKLIWVDGKYKVSEPNIDTCDVVTQEFHEREMQSLRAENERMREALRAVREKAVKRGQNVYVVGFFPPEAIAEWDALLPPPAPQQSAPEGTIYQSFLLHEEPIDWSLDKDQQRAQQRNHFSTASICTLTAIRGELHCLLSPLLL